MVRVSFKKWCLQSVEPFANADDPSLVGIDAGRRMSLEADSRVRLAHSFLFLLVCFVLFCVLGIDTTTSTRRMMPTCTLSHALTHT